MTDYGQLLNPLTLKYSKEQVEMDFIESNSNKKRKDNLIITIKSSIVSFLLTVYFIIADSMNYKIAAKLNVQLLQLNSSELTNVLNNQSDIAPEYIFSRKFVLVNNTLYNSGLPLAKSIISSNIPAFLQLADNLYHDRGNMIIQILLTVVFLALVVFAFFTQLAKYQKFIFFATVALFSLPYNLISGILRVNFRMSPEFMYFPILVQIVIYVIIAFKYNTDWFLFTIATLLGLVAEIVIYFGIVHSVSALVGFVIFYAIAKLILIFISYSIEKKIKYEYYVRKNLQNERNYVVDLLSNMEQGFITFNPNVLFINESMKGIIKEFSSEEGKSDSFMGKVVDRFFFKEAKRKDSENILRADLTDASKNDKDLLSSVEEEMFVGKLLKSNVKFECKRILEKLLKSLIDINPALPENLVKQLFEENEARKTYLNVNSEVMPMPLGEQTNSNLDSFYKKVVESGKYSSFTYLGKIDLFTEDPRTSNRRYELLFREISHNYNDKFLEIMFIDKTDMAKIDREKEANNSVGLYSKKIVNEIQMPIETIYELSKFLISEAKIDKEGMMTPMMKENVENINKLTRVMRELLKDFNLYRMQKFCCEKICALENMIACLNCGLYKFCDKCKICKNCEARNMTSFDLSELFDYYVEIFQILNKQEKGYDSNFLTCTIQSDLDIKTNFIFTNKEILASVLFNIFFFAYRRSKAKTEIKVKVNRILTVNNSISTLIEISDTSGIEQGFIKVLSQNPNFYVEVNNDMLADEDKITYNKIYTNYFELYVAFFLVKKLGAILQVESNGFGSTYSFTLNESQSQQTTNDFSLSQINTRFNDRVSDFADRTNLDETIVVDAPMMSTRNSNLFISQRSLDNRGTNNKKLSTNTLINSSRNLLPLKKSNSVKIKNMVQSKTLIVVNSSIDKNNIKNNFRTLTATTSNKYDIFESANGYEALNLVYEIVANQSYLDYVIVDEELPNMQLSTFTKLLRQIFTDKEMNVPKIICYTDSNSQQKKDFLIRSGVDTILLKQSDFADFKNII